MTTAVLLVEDHAATRDVLCGALSQSGFDVVAASNGVEAIARLAETRVDAIVSDYRMDRMDGLELLRRVRKSIDVPFILYSASADATAIFKAGRYGAVFFLEYPFRVDTQLVPTIVESLSSRVPSGKPTRGADRLIGDSVISCRLRAQIRRIGPSNAAVLITGDTGTGKELVAQAIHEESGRERFVAIAVTELSESVLESELFGHARGAFTGAFEAHAGLFEQAHGGTLFLDEIGDAPPRVQAKLLRVLETAEVRPLGGRGIQRVNVRLLTATNRALPERVHQGLFRQDLYFRIRQATLQIPPLRERLADVEPISRHLLKCLAREARLPVPDLEAELLECLRAQAWNGNVRELRALLQNLLLDWDGESPIDRSAALRALAETQGPLTSEDQALCERMLDAYRRGEFNQEAARRDLGMSRGEWRHRWSRLGLEHLARRRP